MRKQKPKSLYDVYRYYDINDRLLYVGMSISAVKRLQMHKSKARWIDRVTTIRIEKFHSKREALNAEKKAIETERPEFNVTYSNMEYPKYPLSLAGVCREFDIPYRKAVHATKGNKKSVEDFMADYLKISWDDPIFLAINESRFTGTPFTSNCQDSLDTKETTCLTD